MLLKLDASKSSQAQSKAKQSRAEQSRAASHPTQCSSILVLDKLFPGTLYAINFLQGSSSRFTIFATNDPLATSPSTICNPLFLISPHLQLVPCLVLCLSTGKVEEKTGGGNSIRIVLQSGPGQKEKRRDDHITLISTSYESIHTMRRSSLFSPNHNTPASHT